MFLQYLITDPQYFLWWIMISVFSVTLHELFHALAAYREGDSTARDAGYFTLNPLVHMGGMSLLLLVFTGMCWGACPVNPGRLKHRYSEALVAFAGPFANLLLTVLCAFLAILIASLPPEMMPAASFQKNLFSFLQLASMVNATLFVLNMIPIPPLDGHVVLDYFVPGTRQAFAPMQAMMFPMFFILLAMGLSQFLWAAGAFLSQACLMLGSTVFLMIRGV